MAGASTDVVGAAAVTEVVAGAATDADVETGVFEDTATEDDRLTA